MSRPQDAEQQQEKKSQGRAPKDSQSLSTEAKAHGNQRELGGFDINQTTAKYWALLASVIRLGFENWPKLCPAEVVELVGFNEAMDQVLAK